MATINKKYIHLILLGILLLGLPACAGAIKGLYPAVPGAPDNVTIYVASHGWHTGVIIPGKEARNTLPLDKEKFKTAKFVEIGWGDAGFYQAGEITSGLTMRAMFWPTDTVLHVAAIPMEPKNYFAHSQLIKLKLSGKGFAKLALAIRKSFALNEKKKSIYLREGIYGKSSFYKAVGTYYCFNTCNSWTARIIRASGFPISTFYALSAGNVMGQCSVQLARSKEQGARSKEQGARSKEQGARSKEQGARKKIIVCNPSAKLLNC